jgi:RHS repeat-associated protein
LHPGRAHAAPSGATKFLHGDFLGTFSTETNAAQNVTATKQCDPFGNLESSSGTSASPFGFAGGWGYQEDGDSGLKLVGHRYYDPTTGRFLTRDPAQDGRNWYTYCDNNPLRWADDDGCKPVLVIIEGDWSNNRWRNLLLVLRLMAKHQDRYTIKVVKADYPEDVDDALSTADAAILVGHGRPFCTRKGQSWAPTVRCKDIARRRHNAGKGDLQWIRVYSCNTLNDGDDALYLGFFLITRYVFAFTGSCYPEESADNPDGAGGDWYDRGFFRPPVRIGGGNRAIAKPLSKS